MTRHTILLLYMVFWPYGQHPHPHTQGVTRVIQSRSLQLGLPSRRWGVITCHKDGVITHHKDMG